MIYLYLFGTCFHFIYVFMIIDKYLYTKDEIGKASADLLSEALLKIK